MVHQLWRKDYIELDLKYSKRANKLSNKPIKLNETSKIDKINQSEEPNNN